MEKFSFELKEIKLNWVQIGHLDGNSAVQLWLFAVMVDVIKIQSGHLFAYRIIKFARLLTQQISV